MTPTINYLVHAPVNDAMRFENPTMLKVIANLIAQSEKCLELMKASCLFFFLSIRTRYLIIIQF